MNEFRSRLGRAYLAYDWHGWQFRARNGRVEYRRQGAPEWEWGLVTGEEAFLPDEELRFQFANLLAYHNVDEGG